MVGRDGGGRKCELLSSDFGPAQGYLPHSPSGPSKYRIVARLIPKEGLHIRGQDLEKNCLIFVPFALLKSILPPRPGRPVTSFPTAEFRSQKAQIYRFSTQSSKDWIFLRSRAHKYATKLNAIETKAIAKQNKRRVQIQSPLHPNIPPQLHRRLPHPLVPMRLLQHSQLEETTSERVANLRIVHVSSINSIRRSILRAQQRLNLRFPHHQRRHKLDRLDGRSGREVEGC